MEHETKEVGVMPTCYCLTFMCCQRLVFPIFSVFKVVYHAIGFQGFAVLCEVVLLWYYHQFVIFSSVPAEFLSLCTFLFVNSLNSSPLSMPEKRFVRLIRHLQFRFGCLSS